MRWGEPYDRLNAETAAQQARAFAEHVLEDARRPLFAPRRCYSDTDAAFLRSLGINPTPQYDGVWP